MKHVLSLILAFCLLQSSAFASDCSRLYDTSAELPESVVMMLPQNETFQYGYQEDERMYLLLSDEHGYRVRICRLENEAWITEAVSSLILPWQGDTPSIGVGAFDVLYIQFSENEYASLSCKAENGWLLSGWYRSDAGLGGAERSISFYPHGICVRIHTREGEHRDYREEWYYGDPTISYAIDQMNPSMVLQGIDTIGSLLDMSQWGVVSPGGNASACTALHAAPSNEADVLCSLFRGAPVQIKAQRDAWLLVQIAGMEGWLPISEVQQGAGMAAIHPAFATYVINPSDRAEAAAIHCLPADHAEALTRLSQLDPQRLSEYVIIGQVNEDWYIIYHPQDNLMGFIEAQWLYEGNG